MKTAVFSFALNLPSVSTFAICLLMKSRVESRRSKVKNRTLSDVLIVFTFAICLLLFAF